MKIVVSMLILSLLCACAKQPYPTEGESLGPRSAVADAAVSAAEGNATVMDADQGDVGEEAVAEAPSSEDEPRQHSKAAKFFRAVAGTIGVALAVLLSVPCFVFH